MKNKKEWIKLKTAMRITGFTESTLRNKLKYRVTFIGKYSFDREEFFDFWREENRTKRKEVLKKENENLDFIEGILPTSKRNNF